MTAHAEMTAEWSTTARVNGEETRWIRRLVILNLGLVALQALSAGLLLSGYGSPAATAHAAVAVALQIVALAQAVTAVVLWRRRRTPASVAGSSVGLLVMVTFEVALGHGGWYWLHVPIAMGLFGGLIRQLNRLGA